MSRIEITSQVNTGYSVKTDTNSEGKVEDGTDFASMLTKCQKKTAQDDKTKEAETGETKNNKETATEEVKNKEKEDQKTDEIKTKDVQQGDEKDKRGEDIEQDQELTAAYASEACYRTFVQMTAENNDISAAYNNGIQEISVQPELETGIKDQTAVTETGEQMTGTAEADSKADAGTDIFRIQNGSEQPIKPEKSEQTVKTDQEENMLAQEELISGKETAALVSASHAGMTENPAGTGTIEASAGTAADQLPTTTDTLTEDLGSYLNTKISEKSGKLEVSLEPERLGKLTIRLEYEKGKTDITIFSTSAKTLEILGKEAGHLAQILEEKTGMPTVIYTPEQSENRQNMDQDPGQDRGGRQEHRERRQKQDDSFAQQLRLGLA